jgi:ArsR family transcriptional regulator
MSSAPITRLAPEQVQAIARALAEPRRFAILQQIAQQPSMRCSCLNERECISPATLSHHMKELQEAGLIEVEREGRAAKLTLRRDVWDAYLRELSNL